MALNFSFEFKCKQLLVPSGYSRLNLALECPLVPKMRVEERGGYGGSQTAVPEEG